MRRHPAPIALVAISATLLWAVTVAAQGEVPDASPTSAGAKTIEVVGVEYAFVGLPTAVGTGTQLVFVNTGAEFHELAVGRIDEDSDATLEELVELGAAAFTEGTVEILPEGPLVANPAETAQGTLTLMTPGRYLATCLVPQGMVPDILAGLGVTADMAPADWPPEAQAILDNPTHAELGMVQVFTVVP